MTPTERPKDPSGNSQATPDRPVRPDLAVYVCLDTEPLKGEGFNFETRKLRALAKFATDGLVRIVITEIVDKEVRRKIRQDIKTALDAYKLCKAEIEIFRASPSARGLLELPKKADLVLELNAGFDQYLARTKAETIPVADLRVGPVIDKYFNGEPPFSGGAEQFRDAFSLQALLAWRRTLAVPPRRLVLVTGDKGLGAAAVAENIEVFADLADLLNDFNDTLQTSATSEEIQARRAFLIASLLAQRQEVERLAAACAEGLPTRVADGMNGQVRSAFGHTVLMSDNAEDIKIITVTADRAYLEVAVAVHYSADLEAIREINGLPTVISVSRFSRQVQPDLVVGCGVSFKPANTDFRIDSLEFKTPAEIVVRPAWSDDWLSPEEAQEWRRKSRYDAEDRLTRNPPHFHLRDAALFPRLYAQAVGALGEHKELMSESKALLPSVRQAMLRRYEAMKDEQGRPQPVSFPNVVHEIEKMFSISNQVAIEVHSTLINEGLIVSDDNRVSLRLTADGARLLTEHNGPETG